MKRFSQHTELPLCHAYAVELRSDLKDCSDVLELRCIIVGEGLDLVPIPIFSNVSVLEQEVGNIIMLDLGHIRPFILT